MPPQVRVGAGLTTATTATPDAADAGVVDGRVEKEDGVGPQVLRALLDRASKMTEVNRLCHDCRYLVLTWAQAQWQQLLAARPAAATVDPADSADRADPPDLATTAAPLTTTTTAAAAAAAAAAATTTTGRSAATTAAAVQRQREDLEKQTVSDVE